MMRTTLHFFFVSFLAALPVSVSAQPPGPGQPGDDPLQAHLFPPEVIMQNQNALGLGDDQKERIRGEIASAQGRFLELQWTLQDAMEELVDLVKQTGASEEQVLSRLDAVLDAERAIKRAQLSLLIRIKNDLTAEQQDRLRRIRREGGASRPRGN